MDTGFFTWVWRFNALALAGLLILALTLILWEEVIGNSRRTTNTVNIDQTDTSLEESFVIGEIRTIDGLIRYSVGRKQTFDNSYGSSKKTAKNIANYGYIDPNSGELRWLLDGFSTLITRTFDVQRATPPTSSLVANPPEKELVGTLYLIIDADTNGDKRLSRSDMGRLAVSRPDGTGFKTLIEGIDVLGGVQDLNTAQKLIRFTQGDGEKAAILDLATLDIKKILDIPVGSP